MATTAKKRSRRRNKRKPTGPRPAEPTLAGILAAIASDPEAGAWSEWAGRLLSASELQGNDVTTK